MSGISRTTVDGTNGWSPVLLPETDGTRTLLKVTNWMNGSGTKPAVGMYLSETGYTLVKADAFNFNRSKRLDTYAAVSAADGTVTVVFATPFPAPPRVLVSARGATTGRPAVAEVVKDSVTATQCVIRVSQPKATLLSLGATLFDLLAGVSVDVIVVET